MDSEELNIAVANEAFAENKVYMLEKQLKEAQGRIKRLIEAGDEMEKYCTDYHSSNRWYKAKEAKL